MDELWQLQDLVFHDRREFKYQFEDDRVRDEALGAVVAHFVADGASTVTATPEGINLQGTCLSRGADADPGAVRLDEGLQRVPARRHEREGRRPIVPLLRGDRQSRRA